MVIQKKSLGEYLVGRSIITDDQLRQAREVQKSAPGDLGNIIVDLGFASERDVAAGTAQEMGISFVDLSRYDIRPEAVRLIPEHLIKRYNVLPINRDDNNRMIVAVADPRISPLVLDDLRIVSKHQPIPVLVSRTDIEEAILKFAGQGGPQQAGVIAGQQARPNNGARGVSATSRKQQPGKNGAADGGSAYPALIRDENAQTPAIIDPGIAGLPSTFQGGGANLANQIQGELLQMVGMGEDDDDEALRDMSDDAPIIRISHTIIQQAIREGASDIHIEPEKRGVRIRYRVDGVLNEIMTVPKHIQPPLIARFKIMADMNIAERRLPQDGRIPIRSEGKDYDLRVSSIPAQYGEKIVMRILDKTSVMIPLGNLGFAPDMQGLLEELVTQPQGFFLTTGPTGSGKTTTLYSVLNKISTVEMNVCTVEEPVEYQLPGIAQVAVNRKAGLTFANALRAFLRQDPDIVMVGETRDLETATVAIEAALTGHLVLSTLHTNDAPSAVMRLADMGIESYLIAATVTGVMAQRLARRLCGKCKEPYQVPAQRLKMFGFNIQDEGDMVTLHRPVGCDDCRKGYRGRIGLYELMRVTEEIAELIVRRAPVAEIRESAKASGMKELREDGLDKVLAGVTTPEEVRRVVFTAGY